MISKLEFDLLRNTEWIHRKRETLKKIDHLFYAVSENLNAIPIFQDFKSKHPELKYRPKVNKGEMLQGLPFRILDFPVFYSKENVLAFRLLFWWGQPIYNMLHVKGTYLNRVNFTELNAALSNQENLGFRNSGAEWDFDFDVETPKSVENKDAAFIQVWKKHPLEKLAQLPEIYSADFALWNSLLI